VVTAATVPVTAAVPAATVPVAAAAVIAVSLDLGGLDGLLNREGESAVHVRERCKKVGRRA
jgi:hypothetical protein